MNRKPFHCHPSIILEKAGGFLIAWLLILLSQTDEIVPVLISGDFDAKTLETILFFLIFMLLLPGLIAGYQFLIWKKTWIYLDENTLIIERNTLIRKKNAYSISHIANINTEQNLFELLLHTCRVKIDLENATDAESTDISIVLSCKKAQELKTLLLSLRQNSDCPSNAESNTDMADSPSYASLREILVHCICSLSSGFWVTAAVILALGGFLLFSGDISLGELLWDDKEADFSMKVLAAGVIVISYSYQIIRRLLAFYHFTAFRLENDLVIRYGFFRKQDYTIPIKNIHALRIIQAPIARLLHLYEAQLVCIGVGDGKEELTQLALCCKKSVLHRQLSEILPEFSANTIDDMHRSPQRTWKIHFSVFLYHFLCYCLAPASLLAYFTKDTEYSMPGILGGITAAALLLFLYRLLKFLCQGFCLGTSMALFSNGSLTKTVMLIPYQNIQHLCLKHGPLSGLLHLQHGSVYILASMLSREIPLPYLEKETVQKLTENMMSHKT